MLGKSLSAHEPRLLKDWDYKKNEDDPNVIKPFSKKKIFWICHLDSRHKWSSTLSNRVGLYKRKGQYSKKRNVGCPFCNPSSTPNPWEENNLLYKIKIVTKYFITSSELILTPSSREITRHST